MGHANALYHCQFSLPYVSHLVLCRGKSLSFLQFFSFFLSVIIDSIINLHVYVSFFIMIQSTQKIILASPFFFSVIHICNTKRLKTKKKENIDGIVFFLLISLIDMYKYIICITDRMQSTLLLTCNKIILTASVST